MIIILNQENTDFYYVGYSSARTVRNRISQLKMGNPNSLLTVKVGEMDKDQVKALTSKYRAKVVRGSWFALSQYEVDMVMREVDDANTTS